MKLEPRNRRTASLYEMDPSSGYLLMFKTRDNAHLYQKGSKAAGGAKQKAKVAVKPLPAAKKQKKQPAAASAVAVPLSRKQSSLALSNATEGARTHRWEYALGPSTWGKYEPEASKLVELEYQAWLLQPSVFVRSVRSGDWHYSVNFNTFEQTNLGHKNHRVRKIRRVPVGKQPKAANATQQAKKPAAKKAARKASAPTAKTAAAKKPTSTAVTQTSTAATSAPSSPLAAGVSSAAPLPPSSSSTTEAAAVSDRPPSVSAPWYTVIGTLDTTPSYVPYPPPAATARPTAPSSVNPFALPPPTSFSPTNPPAFWWESKNDLGSWAPLGPEVLANFVEEKYNGCLPFLGPGACWSDVRSAGQCCNQLCTIVFSNNDFKIIRDFGNTTISRSIRRVVNSNSSL